jgi:hypothetical protein
MWPSVCFLDNLAERCQPSDIVGSDDDDDDDGDDIQESPHQKPQQAGLPEKPPVRDTYLPML